MPQPPKSPPSKGIEGRDAGKPDVAEQSSDAAEQEDVARKGVAARPARANR